MLLVIDVGNTNIVVGVFDGDQLVADFRLHTNERATGDELGLTTTELLRRRGIDVGAVSAVAAANVVPPLARAVDEMSRLYFHCTPLVVGPGIRTGISIKYEDPRLVGADRIANALAGRHLYGAPAILLDFGTATTFDALSAAGEYLGGAMAPGILISLEALVSRASKLNRIELAAPPSVIGRSPAALASTVKWRVTYSGSSGTSPCSQVTTSKPPSGTTFPASPRSVRAPRSAAMGTKKLADAGRTTSSPSAVRASSSLRMSSAVMPAS